MVVIKNMILNQRPRERLLSGGAEVLTDAELLQIVLCFGRGGRNVIQLSHEILDKFSDFHGIAVADIEQLLGVKGIGIAKATSLKAVAEISVRMHAVSKIRKLIKRPDDVFNLIKKNIYLKSKEHLYLISLDSRNRFISKDLISIGTVNETLSSSREIFRTALLKNATSVILVHNHPSQDVSPSKGDILLTENVAQAGNVIGISLLDHVIVSDNLFSSLKALGLFNVKKI